MQFSCSVHLQMPGSNFPLIQRTLAFQSTKGSCAPFGTGMFVHLYNKMHNLKSQTVLVHIWALGSMFHLYKKRLSEFTRLMCSFRARGPTFTHTTKGNISDFECFLCTFGGFRRPRSNSHLYWTSLISDFKGVLCNLGDRYPFFHPYDKKATISVSKGCLHSFGTLFFFSLIRKIESQSSKGLCLLGTFGPRDPCSLMRTNRLSDFKGLMCRFGAWDRNFTYTTKCGISDFKGFLCTFGGKVTNTSSEISDSFTLPNIIFISPCLSLSIYIYIYVNSFAFPHERQ